MAVERSPIEVARRIRQFLDGTGGEWDWDDFTSFPISHSRLGDVRKACCELPNRFPPRKSGWYCDEDGMQLLRDLASGLATWEDGSV
jgi:hypothetical protein